MRYLEDNNKNTMSGFLKDSVKFDVWVGGKIVFYLFAGTVTFFLMMTAVIGSLIFLISMFGGFHLNF